jgi:hypothetical protein
MRERGRTVNVILQIFWPQNKNTLTIVALILTLNRIVGTKESL